MILTSMSEHKDAKKLNKVIEESNDKDDNNQHFLKNIIPSDINDI